MLVQLLLTHSESRLPLHHLLVPRSPWLLSSPPGRPSSQSAIPQSAIRSCRLEEEVLGTSVARQWGAAHNHPRMPPTPSPYAKKKALRAGHLINSENLTNVTLDVRAEGSSRCRTESGDSAPCSPTSQNFQQRSRKKRSFLKIWKRPSHLRQSVPPLERIDTTNDDDQKDADSSLDYHSLPPASTSRHSGDRASTISSYSSSTSRSTISSHMSVQSLPTLPENREQGSDERCHSFAIYDALDFVPADLWYLVPSLEFPFRLLDDTDTSITVPPFFHLSCFAELLEFVAFTRILSSLLHNLAQRGWKVIVRLSELAIYLYRKCASYD
ncbi:hypothetical protein M404DRAFT_32301 [Pisolithus tinctorius Marx 270]|uniref:Uncharacterized protein n=1 Tax=Pisolithus tinctorius Marx 270 TaxID=870435 RepID=A0A0C3JIL7_PISTI|nr:hypothetical protein M404DRAFT_32301 [Pisolithus tinctorius Marx 270]